MKNAIQYYYGLYPENIFQSNGSYEFDINHMHYYLTPYNRSMEELEELYRISIQLLERQIYCHHETGDYYGYQSYSICFDESLYNF